MAYTQNHLPVPPERLWAVIPAGVQSAGGRNPHLLPAPWTLAFETGATWRSWGQRITVTLYRDPNGHGSVLTIATKLKFGLLDWGEGKTIAAQFMAGVHGALAAGAPPPPGSPQPPPSRLGP